MNTQQYQFRLRGLREADGRIKAANLSRVLDALVQTAERTTRLIVTGKGSAKGTRPKWLDATVDFTITGLESGSTILGMEAPQLGDAAYNEFAQQNLWAASPRLDETALDLAARAVEEIQTSDPAGDYFDSAVLEAILKFRKAAGANGVSYELIPMSGARGRFMLDDRTCTRVRERLDDIPAPRAFIVSGRLDEIKHRSGRFRLVTGNGSQLLGRLDSAALDAEMLRPLWGTQTTVEGLVYFKANGQPRFIEARRISYRQEGDDVFEAMPSAETSQTRMLPSIQDRRAQPARFMDLWGAWPGNEPVDELLDQLD